MAVFAATAVAWISRGIVWKDALPMVDDSTIAVAAAISLFIIRFPLAAISPQSSQESRIGLDPSNNDDFNGADMKSGNDDGSSTALLDWKTAVKIPWGVLLLIGGGLTLANGFASTELDDWIAGQLAFIGEMHYPHIIIVLAIVAITVFAGEIISNTATAALFIPITASLAISLGIPPVLLMAPVAIATTTVS